MIRDAAEALEAALGTVDGVRATRDLGAPISPPMAVVGPPRLDWEGMCRDPSSARFLVYLVVPLDDRAIERLWDLLPAVAEAVDRVPDAVVTNAVPGSYPTGEGDLPAYEITVEVSLT